MEENDEEKEEKDEESVPITTKAPDAPLTPEVKKKNPVVLPYVKWVFEQLRRVFKSYDIPAYFKLSNTLRQLLVHPKDKVDKGKVVDPVNHIQCEDCDASYVRETEQSLKTHFQEHCRQSSVTSEVGMAASTFFQQYGPTC